MGKSLESLSHSHNLDSSRDPEGINNYANQPKSFEEHLQSMHRLINSLPITETTLDTNPALEAEHAQKVDAARNAVLQALGQETIAPDDNRIKTCRNRVFKTELGPSYDGHPNVFRTKEDSVYRITGIDQIADIVNCGYVRAKAGKVKGGHENEVFWSIGGPKLNYIDEHPILETSVTTVQNDQIGALSLEDLSAVWITNAETGQRENKLNTIRAIKDTKREDEQFDAQTLTQKLHDGVSLADLSATF